ncbi:MAG TPA: cytochrome c [Gemmataceae bacterium]|nr:cytochrome c [Gemmataceae bacterium]
MSRFRVLCGALLALAAFLIAVPRAEPQTKAPARPAAPRLEAVAETRLLMEGLNQANFRGLERLLKQKPADVEAWTFARGQALLIAETGNLLMLRPPKNKGQDAWMDRAADMRARATALARAAGNQDYPRTRAALADLANSCNRCHQTFRVPVKITPFAEGADRTGLPERNLF